LPPVAKSTEVQREVKISGRAAAKNVMVRSTPLKKTGGACTVFSSGWRQCAVMRTFGVALARSEVLNAFVLVEQIKTVFDV
jgi:hypothetical protein